MSETYNHKEAFCLMFRRIDMLSTTQMIRKLEGMLGTRDLSEWESGFVRTLVGKVESGQVTSLTEKQLDNLQRLHDRHFA